MSQLDNKMVKEMREDIEESVFLDEFGYAIDSLADLETDKDIFDKYCGGDNNGRNY